MDPIIQWTEFPLARRHCRSAAGREPASALRERACVAKWPCMMSRDQWRKFMDQPWVEWGLFAVGVVLIILGIIISPLPGPGGIFLIAPGAALVLKTSMWAKRHYVKFKRWQPKAGRWTDWALQRRSAKRREAIRKAEEQEQEQTQLSETGTGS